MVAVCRCFPGLLLGASLALSGCGITSGSRDAIQAQNRTLTEQNKAQLAEIENLKIHTRGVEDQLIRAEEELGRLAQQQGLDRQKISNLNEERARLEQQFGKLPRGTAPSLAAVNAQLAELSRRYPNLQYDPNTGISKLDTDILFDSGGTVLKPAATKMLTEFAEIMQSPEASQLKIMVVGHTDDKRIKGREVRQHHPNNWHLSTARALTVADVIRQAGLPDDRLGISGFGPHQPISPNDTAEARRRNRRVEIFVVGPETPVVGWTETLGSVYR